MNPALTYLPAYIGLFITEMLAMTCNTFLDIRFGIFPVEFALWTAAFAHSLWIGWRQHGSATDDGKNLMRRYLLIGIVVTILIFIPLWGFPRAGIYLLGTILIAHNCITTTRRQLHLGLLISLVMVLFASSHYRADWTMLFYLIPYVGAAVFTLVAEQINRKATDLKQHSQGQQIIGGQMAAISAATTAILSLGLLIYLITPQVSILSLMWDWGNPGGLISSGKPEEAGAGGNIQGDGNSPSPGPLSTHAPLSGWPSPQEMRQAAAREGMPGWQRSTIYQMADISEWTQYTMQPIMQNLQQLWDRIKQWLQEHRLEILFWLLMFAVMALLLALWRLMREARVMTWLKTRWDYLRLAIFRQTGPQHLAAQQYYRAMERLFELHHLERTSQKNTHEYLNEIQAYFRDLTNETRLVTHLFEDARYGQASLDKTQLKHLHAAYLQLYQRLQ